MIARGGRSSLSARRSAWRTLGWFGAGALAGASAVVFTVGVVRATSTPAFCAESCHSMQPAYESYRRSIHFDNRSGVRATCGDCHVPYESGHPTVLQYIAGTLWTKAIAGGSDIYHELLGKISTSEKWERERPRLTAQVQSWIRKTDSVSCQGCHDLRAYSGPGNFMAIEAHAGMLKRSTVDCTSCHSKEVGHVYASAAPAPIAPAAEGAPAQPTSTGVYTAQQAERGAPLYQRACAACHGADLQGGGGPALVGKPFWTRWGGQKLSSLWNVTHVEMPLTGPGGMSADDSLAVLAYLLQRNGLPPGGTPLDDGTDLSHALPPGPG